MASRRDTPVAAFTCITCGYDLSGFGECPGPCLRCPECGEADPGRPRPERLIYATDIALTTGLASLFISCMVFVLPARGPLPGAIVLSWVGIAIAVASLLVATWRGRGRKRALPLLGLLATAAWAALRLGLL